MIPAVGRVVHYYPVDYPLEAHSARISRVNEDGSVMLHVDWVHGPLPIVRFAAVHFSSTPQPGCCVWPPRVGP